MTDPGVPDLPRVVVVTGIQASGKSSVARLLAERLRPGVHIEADLLQQMIVSGGQWPQKPGDLPPEVARQLRLRLHNSCLLARSFLAAGFNVVIDDIIIGDRYDDLKTEMGDMPMTLVVLAPRLEVVVAARDPNRRKRPLGNEWATYLDRALRTTMSDAGVWIDNSDQSPEETAAEALRRINCG